MDAIFLSLIGSWVGIIVLFVLVGALTTEVKDLRESVIELEEIIEDFAAEKEK